MKKIIHLKIILGLCLVVLGSAQAARFMEDLGRGVVAVRTSEGVFISWRLLGTDPNDIGFNLYRQTTGSSVTTKINGGRAALTGATCYTDTGANLSRDNTYFVRPVIDGNELEASSGFTLSANSPTQPCFTIPLTSGSTDRIHFVWVGDLDADGEYDFVVDRLNSDGRSQSIEAYLRDGTLLWTVDLGVNSTNTYNIEPGSATIDVGHWDGVTVYDLDSDGRAEVLLRTAHGVTFADGSQVVDRNQNHQFISVIDGLTGTERAHMAIPTDYLSDGPMAAHLGIGYLNGETPSLIASMKNRVGNGGFNMMVCAWDFDGAELTLLWKWKRGSQNCPDGHQIRIVDLDSDGMDEFCSIGFVLDQDGTLLYSLGSIGGVVHGDRFHVGKFDPDRPGLQGFGVQQDNASGLLEYYYDASTGEILWTTTGGVWDVGRGDVGDIDPRYSGFECWSFHGLRNGPSGHKIANNQAWPVLRLWWDDDDLSESFNDGKIEKWYYQSTGVGRVLTTWHFEGATRSDRGVPMFYGDILGDWREEVVMTSWDYTKLVIFTTDIPTERRLYTLAHNPAYRNCMTIKGYMQSHHVDYYLGDGMETPCEPNIIPTVYDPNED